MSIDLEELKRLHEAATPGEWELCNKGDYGDFDDKSRVVISDDRRLMVFHVSDPETNANAELLFALRNAWPSILAKLEAAQRLRDVVVNHFGTQGIVQFPTVAGAVVAFNRADKETE